MSKVLDALAFAQSLARRPALRTARNEHGHAVVPPEVPALEWKATSRLAGLSLVPGRWWVVSRGTEKLPVLAVVREFELRLVGSDEPARTYTVEWPLDRSKPEGLAFASAMTLSTRYLEVELLQLPIAMGPDEGGSAAPSGETPAAQDFELEQLGLSPRTLATLKNHRIWSALDLCRFTRRELLRLEGVGPGALLEVSQALQAKGLALDVEPAPDLSKEFGDLPDIHQNNATTAPGEASSPGEKGDSSTGQASRPVEDLPAKGSVVAPSKDPMLAVVEAAPESPDGVKKIPARAFIQVQSEGEATPQPPAPQVDGRSPDQQVSPSAGLFLNCVECQRGLTVSGEAFVDENDDGPYCAACWKARPVVTKGTSVEPTQGRVLYPIEPNKDGFTDECPECDSQITNVPSDDLIHDGARLFCEKGHELGVSVRDGKAHVEPVRGGPAVDIESREPAASGPSSAASAKDGPEGQVFECDFCGKALAKKSAKTMHERACKDKSPGQRKSVEPAGPRDPKVDPRTGDVLAFEGWVYTVQSLTPGKGRKQTRLDIRKEWTDASGAKAQDSRNWSLGAWRAFFRSRESQAATKPPEASQGSAEPHQEAMPVAAGGESLDVVPSDVVRQGLAPIATWKEESS